jgi:6-pyruvoyltetrahydropterin/6-carboxytetrahydropterin synthase
MQTIKVVHELQMAHRLPNLPGKCQRIHGHTWKVVLTIGGKVDDHGILLDYTEVKAKWRTWLDDEFDHRLVLWKDDPLMCEDEDEEIRYPGVKLLDCDPTVENLSRIFGAGATGMFSNGKSFNRTFAVELWEGNNNCATWEMT